MALPVTMHREQVSVVVPSIKDTVLTRESIPDRVECHVVGEPYTLNEARNAGIERTDAERILVMDDDIAFPPAVFETLVRHIDRETLVGLAGWDYGLIAGRVMGFPRSLWDDIGGFDERLKSHMGDTDFAIRAQKAGYEIERVPREVIYHHPHGRDNTTWDHAWRGVYLAGKHPTYAPRLARGMVA